jgi:hypothetical protein
METILFKFCRPDSPVMNAAIYWASQYELLLTQTAIFNFFDSLELITDAPTA